MLIFYFIFVVLYVWFCMVFVVSTARKKKILHTHLSLKITSGTHAAFRKTLFRSRASAWIVLNPEVVVEVEKRMNRCYLPPRLMPGGHLKAAGGGPTLTHHRKASMYPTNTGKLSFSFLFSFYFLSFLFFILLFLIIVFNSLSIVIIFRLLSYYLCALYVASVCQCDGSTLMFVCYLE